MGRVPHRIMAVNLNASKSIETVMLVGLRLTGVKKNDPNGPDTYKLNIRKGIFEVNPPSAGVGQFVINTDDSNPLNPLSNPLTAATRRRPYFQQREILGRRSGLFLNRLGPQLPRRRPHRRARNSL